MERDYYELSLLISANLEEETAKSFFQKIASELQDQGALLDKIENPKRIELAYPVKKLKSAYFGWLTFFLPKEKIESFQEKLREKNEILRFLLIKEEPPAIKQEKAKKKPKEEKIEKVTLEEIEKKLEELI